MDISVLEKILQQQSNLPLHRSLRQSDLLVIGKQLANIHSQGKANVAQYFTSIDWNNIDDSYSIQLPYVIIGFVSDVKETADNVFEFFHTIYTKISRRYHNLLLTAFDKWAKTHPHQLEQLSKLLESSNSDSPFGNSLLRNWCKHDQDATIVATLNFVNIERETLKRDAILALGDFENLSEENHFKTMSALKTITLTFSEDSQCHAIISIQRLLKRGRNNTESLPECLMKLSENPTSNIRHFLIGSFVELRSIYPEQLCNRIIELMKSVPKNKKETIELIDFTLYQLDTKVDRTTIFNILTGLLSQQDHSPSLDDFESTIPKILSSNDQTVGWYISKWLHEGNPLVCHQLNMIFPPNSEKLFKFNLDDLNHSKDEIFILSKRIFCYLILSRGIAVSLLCECLRKLKYTDRRQLEFDIANYWLRNYQEDIKLFEQVINSKSSKSLQSSLIRLKSLRDQYIKPLKSLSRNSAFTLTSTEQSIENEVNENFSEEIAKEAQQKSLFLSFLPVKKILHGRSCITYTQASNSDSSVRNTIELQNFSTKIVVPSMDILCPNYLSYLRKTFSFVRD